MYEAYNQHDADVRVATGGVAFRASKEKLRHRSV